MQRHQTSKFTAYYALFALTAVYALNIADRFVLSTLVEPIKHEFQLSDSGVAFLTGAALALFYVAFGIPLGRLADRVNRRLMIVTAIITWSIFTLLCGLAPTFWIFLLFRLGVGIGEAGGTPPSHSLLADTFPPRERSVAMTVFSLGTVIGAAIGGAVAGWIADAYGWRAVLIVFGAAGLPIALLAFFVREPRRGQFEHRTAAAGHAKAGIFRLLRDRPAFTHMLIASTLFSYGGSGLLWWTPAFLNRTHGLSVEKAGQLVGVINGIGGTAALLLAAALTWYLERRGQKALLTGLALAGVAMAAAAVLTYTSNDMSMVTLGLWLFVPLGSIFVGPVYGLLQNLVEAEQRGLSIAIFLFMCNIANLVLAPQIIGGISDLLTAEYGNARSLQLAIIISIATGVWASVHFLLARRSIDRDMATAQAV